GRLVGSAMLYPAETDAYGALASRAGAPEIRLVAVAPEARGRGIAKALVEECIRRARAQGASEVGLHTSRSMRAGARLSTAGRGARRRVSTQTRLSSTQRIDRVDAKRPSRRQARRNRGDR